MSASVKSGGTPREAKRARGCAPFAAKSLMFITTAFRAVCQRFMAFGASVFLTSMSMLITANLLFPMSTAEASSLNGRGVFGIWSRQLRRSFMIFLSPSSLAVTNLEPFWYYLFLGILRVVCHRGNGVNDG